MTMRAPERAGHSVGGPAYPVCTHWALARDAAPPFEPPASRAAAEHRTDGGAAPGPPYRCALGGGARRCGNPRPAADPAAFGLARPGRFVH